MKLRPNYVAQIIAIENAGLRLEAVTACPREQAHRIASRLGAEATEGLVDTIARSGVPLEQIADALTNPKETR